MKVWRSRVGGADTATAPSRGSKFIGVDVGGTKILGLVTDGVGPTATDRELQATPKHDPDELHTKLVPVDYEPDAEYPVFEKFISETAYGADALAAYLQRLLGMCLTGDISEQIDGIGRKECR